MMDQIEVQEKVGGPQTKVRAGAKGMDEYRLREIDGRTPSNFALVLQRKKVQTEVGELQAKQCTCQVYRSVSSVW